MVGLQGCRRRSADISSKLDREEWVHAHVCYRGLENFLTTAIILIQNRSMWREIDPPFLVRQKVEVT